MKCGAAPPVAPELGRPSGIRTIRGNEAMTDVPADILPLAGVFPPATREQWLDLVARLLKGAPFERKLVSKTYDGLTIQPLYEGRAQGRVPVGRMPGAGWQILQRIDHPEATAANAEARHD